MDAAMIADAFEQAIADGNERYMEWARGPCNNGPWCEEAYRFGVWLTDYNANLALSFRAILQAHQGASDNG